MSKCGKKGWIVETKNVYKKNNKRKLVPIRLDESDDTLVYVRNVGVPLNDLLVVGSDDDPKVLRDRHYDGIKRIRTLKINKYSRAIQPQKTTATALTVKHSSRRTAKKDAAHISGGYYRNIIPREKPKSSKHPKKRNNSSDYESFEDRVDPEDTEEPENIDDPEDPQYDVEVKIGEKDLPQDDGDLEVDGEEDLHDLSQDDGDLDVDDPEDPQDDGEIEIEGVEDPLLLYRYCCNGDVDGSSRANRNINSSLPGKRRNRDTSYRVLGESTNSLAAKLNLRNRRLKNINSNMATKRLQRNFVNSRRPGKLEAKVNSLVKKFVEDSPKQASNEENLILPVPNFEESIIKDGTKEFLVIDGLRIDTDHLSDILKQNTMRKRANHIMREMWPPDVMGRMFLRRQTAIDIQTLTTSADRRKLRNVCLHFQKRKEIKYCAGSKDDIDVYIKEWMSSIFRECRRKIRRKVTD
ncbi:unnamed protein product [Euphydryas editha]|uniref:Uncharacterized protein n=1 Tax=Euphydryas editha TaxID=104508 RepID=A0AAU9UR48_EUPED|nr:unnamed protein product [Euphydryas editha]